jgi:NADPH:quinone reductase-like Zn-dependent oxidoreductase
MRAIQFRQYGPPQVLRLEELDLLAPGPGQVRVRMLAAGVAPVDAKIRSGLLQAQLPMALPKIPGRDGVGMIDAVGANVTGLVIGDSVCIIADMLTGGTYAESVIVAQEHAVLTPRGLSVHAAAALLQPGLSACIPVLEVAQVKPGMKVLVHSGSGAVGSLMVQLASHLGAEVSATCRTANRDYVYELGASKVIAYDGEDLGQLRDQDVVFDLVGGSTHERSYPVLKKGGHLVWLVAAPIIDRSVQYGVRVSRALITNSRQQLQQVVNLAAQEVLRPRVAQVMPLTEAAAAHAALEQAMITRGRLVLEIRQQAI